MRLTLWQGRSANGPFVMVAKHVSRGQRLALSAQAGLRPRQMSESLALIDANWRLMAPIMALVGLVTSASTKTIQGGPNTNFVNVIVTMQRRQRGSCSKSCHTTIPIAARPGDSALTCC